MLDELRDKFARDHCVVLNKLLTEDLLPLAERQLVGTDFRESTYYGTNGSSFGKEETLSEKTNFLTPALSLMLNGDTFINAIRHITHKPEIQSFHGRIYRLHESKNSFLKWHDDSNKNEERIIGISLNLSIPPYAGGHFLIRNRKTKEVYKEVYYKEWGSAHIFRIDNALEHMVTDVTGEQARITLAGWFYPKNGIKELLNK